MEVIVSVIRASADLFNKMSFFLLFGYFLAGIIHMFIGPEKVRGHLGGKGPASVFKAAVFGIPLPLCSCSVIPTSLSLRKQGAGKGSIVSFLITAPTTGADSLMATYSLMGLFFTFYRAFTAFVIGAVAGILTNFFAGDEEVPVPESDERECKFCKGEQAHHAGWGHRISGIFKYSFGELLYDSGGWILAGVIIGGMITLFIPQTFVEEYLGSGWLAMVVMLLVGVPMYVCATASIPIAAALIMKGVNPGAAVVFLIAGPATNTLTILAVQRSIGFKGLMVYILSICGGALVFGFMFDYMSYVFGKSIDVGAMASHELISPQIQIFSSSVLFILITWSIIKKYLKRRERSGSETHNA